MLVLTPLVVMFIATWRMWEPDRVPSFRLILLALGLQLGVLVYYVMNHAPLLSLFFGGVVSLCALIFMLHKAVKAEQIQRRIDDHRRRFGTED